MRNEISRIFAGAGQTINFINSSAAADYSLSIEATAPSTYGGQLLPSNAVGVTGVIGSFVNNAGSVYINRLTASATVKAADATAFGQNSNALPIGLGRAGAHEIAHNFLQQNYDSSRIQGVMHAGFSGGQWFSSNTQGLWTFNAFQIWKMNNSCKPVTTDTTVPNNSPIIRGSGGGGGGGRDIRPIFGSGWGGFGGWSSLDLLYLMSGGGGGGYGEVLSYKLDLPE